MFANSAMQTLQLEFEKPGCSILTVPVHMSVEEIAPCFGKRMGTVEGGKDTTKTFSGAFYSHFMTPPKMAEG